jgi:hypothetical protein
MFDHVSISLRSVSISDTLFAGLRGEAVIRCISMATLIVSSCRFWECVGVGEGGMGGRLASVVVVRNTPDILITMSTVDACRQDMALAVAFLCADGLTRGTCKCDEVSISRSTGGVRINVMYVMLCAAVGYADSISNRGDALCRVHCTNQSKNGMMGVIQMVYLYEFGMEGVSAQMSHNIFHCDDSVLWESVTTWASDFDIDSCIFPSATAIHFIVHDDPAVSMSHFSFVECAFRGIFGPEAVFPFWQFANCTFGVIQEGIQAEPERGNIFGVSVTAPLEMECPPEREAPLELTPSLLLPISDEWRASPVWRVSSSGDLSLLAEHTHLFTITRQLRKSSQPTQMCDANSLMSVIEVYTPEDPTRDNPSYVVYIVVIAIGWLLAVAFALLLVALIMHETRAVPLSEEVDVRE